MNNLLTLKKLEFFIFLLISLLFAYYFQKNFIPSEDASILFRYAENLADTGVITYNLNGSPTEGATDFLWMVILSLFYLIGFNTYFASIFLNLLSLYLIVKLLQKYYSLSKIDFYLIFFFHFTLTQTYSAIAGFSVLFVELILILVLINFLKQKIFLTLFFSFIGCLVRPDFILFIIIPNLINLIKNFNLKTIRLYIIFFIFGLVYFFLRYNYFELLFPLPFYIKNQWSIFNNLEWGRQIIILLPTILIFFVADIKEIFKKSVIIFMSICFLATSYYTNQILYQNIGYRFYFYFPVFALLILYEIQIGSNKIKKNVRVIIFLTSIFSLIINLAQQFNSVSFLTKNEDIYVISKQLGEVNKKIRLNIATTEAGLLPYYSKINTIDLFGLNTKKFAKKPADGKVFWYNDFDFIIINSSVTGKDCNSLNKIIDESKENKNLEANRSDDWSTFSKKLLSGIDINKYDAYFLTYPKHIFVNRQSKAYKEITNIVKDKMVFRCNLK